mmetsp:Transcript_8174/g.12208  ORF Transcript_8174/g.12208 Transcript_8174/m.12208 type:complete len:215 (+) Transcript_8174:85-729(+)|eukprot:CAMPEP_0185019578 /NCGR_PEP_ID=MMETSP1103-20130426/2204_1 /TAXON_ID=36769 /ORGANISM="Paraphysomonas bandaiensis, Strain Caron Lab Isolate" /LENGTH=214 /DNA_ID=CAMNT_0027549979 /DNA_START=42 /DNA_END=686 /DNA_ORIENTATION=+
MTEHERKAPKRRTMVKDRVGCVKATTRNLPEGPFVYGMKSPPDPEGAGEVISNWITADPSASKASVRSHIHSNILAIKHGAVTAKAARKFAEDHTHIRMKEILNAETNTHATSAFEGPFGQKTVYADESMEALIQAKYTNFSNYDADYPSLDGLVDKSALPLPRSTRASTMVESKTKSANKEEPKKPFTMKKFQNIPGKLNLPKSSAKTPTSRA